jgi:hypothetical protein
MIKFAFPSHKKILHPNISRQQSKYKMFENDDYPENI